MHYYVHYVINKSILAVSQQDRALVLVYHNVDNSYTVSQHFIVIYMIIELVVVVAGS